jgi:hypothetical protein
VILELKGKNTGTTQFISQVPGTILSADSDVELQLGWVAEYIGNFELRAFTTIEDLTTTSVSNVAISEVRVYA